VHVIPIVLHISSFASYTHLQLPQNLVLVERAPITSLHPLLNMASGIVLKRPDPPVFSLPRDVLEEIFIFRVNNKPPVLRDFKSISQVCRHWREIVVGWPSLWERAISLDELNQVPRCGVIREPKYYANKDLSAAHLRIFGRYA